MVQCDYFSLKAFRAGQSGFFTRSSSRHPMINNFQDFQKLGQTNVDTAVKMLGDWNKGWQAIAAEMSDYSKRAFEDGTATFEKLMSAKSVEQAFEIQTSFAKRAYDDYMHQMTKIGSMYSDLAKDAYKPVEKAFQNTVR